MTAPPGPPSPPGRPQNLQAVWGSGPNDIFTVGANGTILHSTGSITVTTTFTFSRPGAGQHADRRRRRSGRRFRPRRRLQQDRRRQRRRRGAALGGGVWIQADIASVNTSTVASSTLNGNTVTGGNGGAGGQGGAGTDTPPGTIGVGSAGGAGGLGAGGGLYNSSLNTATSSTLLVSGDALASNEASGGTGGAAGTGNTGDGGDGGNGGNGGNGEGGGLFNGDNTVLTVINSTFGGTTLATASNPLEFSNTLDAGNGGPGGNGGTAGGTLKFSSGGNGGAGGSTLGGAVYIHSGTANFINDTILNNVAELILTGLTGGAGGTPGDAAGNGGGAAGTAGAAGVAAGGGYYANAGTNNLGNTIIDLNTAGSNLSGTFVSTSPDLAGMFVSKGHNIIGSTTGSSGLVASDQTGVTAAQLNLGPLQNTNGGPTATEGLLAGSVAIGAGNPALVTSPPFSSPATDQRGSGFPRSSTAWWTSAPSSFSRR